MKHKLVLCSAALLLAVTAAGFASEHMVTQKGKAFSSKEVAVQKGDTVTFRNDDNVTHNVMSKSPGNEFNIGAQAPGVSTPVRFDTAGGVDIFCAIHPQMRMSVKVAD